MTVIELIGVPFDGYGRPGRQASAAAALREAGLAAALEAHDVVDPGDMVQPTGSPERGPATSLVNKAALLAMVEEVGARAVGAVRAGRFPLVLGADCTTLLGTIPSLRADGPVGLLFVDGHEDTMPLDVSEHGEAANTEIGLLLGLTGHLMRGSLPERLPALEAGELAVLGPRDAEWRGLFNVGSLRDCGVRLRDWREVAAAPEDVAGGAVEHLRLSAPRWWLHIDLDVLDPEVFPAQGLLGVADDPDGLTWDQLTRAVTAAVARGGCLGCSIAIYDPDQDPDRSGARRIVRLLAETAAHLAPTAA